MHHQFTKQVEELSAELHAAEQAQATKEDLHSEQLRDLNSELEAAKQARITSEEMYKKQLTAVTDTNQQLQQDKDAQSKRLQELDARAAAAQAERMKSAEMLLEVENRLDMLKEENFTHRAQLRDASSWNKTLEHQLKDAHDRLAETLTMAERLSSERGSLVKQLDDVAKNKQVSEKKAMEQLQLEQRKMQELQQSQTALLSAQAEMEARLLQARANSKAQWKEEREQVRQATRKTLWELEQSKDSLVQQLGNVQAELAAMTSEKTAVAQQVVEGQHRMSSLMEVERVRAQEVKHAQQALEEVEKERADMDASLSTLLRALASLLPTAPQLP